MRTTPFLLALLVLGCDGTTMGADGGSDDAGPMVLDTGPPAPGLPSTLGPSDRPADLVVPGEYDGETALPVLVLLHGYGFNAGAQDAYLGLSRETRRRGFYLILPNGTVDTSGRQFWNATPGCCNFGGSTVDDSAYLMGLIDELESLAPVSDVYFAGHSNGGFMSYRMACDHADRVSAIVSLAGSGYNTEAECGATRGVSVLQIHGDADATIGYAGAAGAYPPATEVVARWAGRAGCQDTPVPGTPKDLDSSLAGDETTIDRYVEGCTEGEVELWTIVGGGHVPALSRTFTPQVLEWLATQAR